jgi:hypothetical protein
MILSTAQIPHGTTWCQNTSADDFEFSFLEKIISQNMFIEELTLHPIASNFRYKKIFDLIAEISRDKIDSKESAIRDNGVFTMISLRSNEGINCPLDIQLGNAKEANKVFLFFTDNINVIYYEDLNTAKNEIMATTKSVLQSRIEKDIVSSSSKIIRIVMRCSALQYDSGEPIEFSSKIGSSWFWQKKEITHLFYNPWI